MVRAPYAHWIHLSTREETIAKYGETQLCNELYVLMSLSGRYMFRCQILNKHVHTWHLVKGELGEKRWTFAWRGKTVRMGEAVSKATEAATLNSRVEPSLSPQPGSE